MIDTLHYIGGGLLFIIGAVLMFFTWRYAVLVYEEKVEISFLMAFLSLIGGMFVLFGIRFLGCSIALSFLIFCLVFGISLYINTIIIPYNEIPLIDKVVATILYILIIGVFILLYWTFKLGGDEAVLESYFK